MKIEEWKDFLQKEALITSGGANTFFAHFP